MTLTREKLEKMHDERGQLDALLGKDARNPAKILQDGCLAELVEEANVERGER